jgi:putative protease
MKLELVAPAKNLEQGTLALGCGADALYIGGPKFGARKGAANELRDLELLAAEARLWRAKVYVTLNTILYEGELEDARRAAWSAFEAGVDALIIQDMAFLEMDLPGIPLHASTQAVCDSPEKIAFLASVGFSRTILARELSLEQIMAIRSAAAGIELEAFVYGAICVSESGHCYLSHAICGRSGNRGECAQPCRRDWSLVDSAGRVLIKDKPLLSIKDLDLSDQLEQLADAGAHSFKIEGRLKDADYVKNIVSYFRRKLDALMEKRPEFCRSSSGRCIHGFESDPAKTFQRGRTTYQLDGERRPILSGLSSGYLGEPVGKIMSKNGSRIVLDRATKLAPGDGLAFSGPSGRIKGTLVNLIEGAQIDVQSPQALNGIKIGTVAHRNFDHAWHKQLRAAKVDRKIGIRARLDFPSGFARLGFFDEDGFESETTGKEKCLPPIKVEAFLAGAKVSLSRLGDTPFELVACQIDPSGFLPPSQLNALRRLAAELLMQKRISSRVLSSGKAAEVLPKVLPEMRLGREWNVSNSLAKAFYASCGASNIEDAFELSHLELDMPLMTTRLCLRFEFGWCEKHKNHAPIAKAADPKGTLFLKNGPISLKCEFDCERCVMKIMPVAKLHARPSESSEGSERD